MAAIDLLALAHPGAAGPAFRNCWSGEGTGMRRTWYIDVKDTNREPELEFLKTEIYPEEIDRLVRRIDAYDRFSNRV